MIGGVIAREIVMLELLAAAAAAASIAGSTVPGIRCNPGDPVRPAAGAAVTAGAAMPKRLGDLPPADHVLTVFRSLDGCPAPVIVRSDIGGRPGGR